MSTKFGPFSGNVVGPSKFATLRVRSRRSPAAAAGAARRRPAWGPRCDAMRPLRGGFAAADGLLSLDLKSVFELCDVDHDGAISLKEFLVTLSLLYLLRAVPTLISIRQDRQDASGLIRPSHSATTVPLFFLETYCT